MKRNKGITLIALIITIIVMLILVAVSVNILIKSNLIGTAEKAADKYKTASEEEKNGAIEIDGKKYSSLDEYVKSITGEIYKHPEQDSSNNDIGIGTDGKPVNLNLWAYEIINENEIHLGKSNLDFGGSSSGYKNENIVNGKIIGTVPQYIYINGEGEPYVVTSMWATFSSCTSLTEAPVIPDTVTDLNQAFYYCTNLSVPPVIPSSVTNLCQTFLRCYNLENSPNIPDGVTNMHTTFYECSKLKEAPIIPDSVENMNETFCRCTSLTTASAISNNVSIIYRCFYECENLVSGPPRIPSRVTNMEETFYKCKKLQGTIKIDADPNKYSYCFGNGAATEGSGLIVTGSSSVLDKIIATGDASKITKGE